MIKEITVAGIKLNNYNVLENLTKIGINLDNNVFTTVEEIYMNTLLVAKEDELVKTTIESMDVTVVSETGILDAVGENTILRRYEIERRDFFFQLMRILERNRYTIYVIGATTKEVEETCQYLADEFSRLKIVGAKAMEEITGADEMMINEINMEAPDVIVSVLPTPEQENFLAEHRAMLSTRLWYGVGSGKITGRKHSLSAILTKKIRERKLKTYIKEQESLEEEKNIEEIEIEEREE